MKLYMATILAVSFLDIFSEGIVRGSVGSQMLPLDSCIELHTRKINIQGISAYEVQERPVKAVILIIKNGVRICVPHNLQWVQNTVKKLNRRTMPKTPRKPKTASRPKPRTS